MANYLKKHTVEKLLLLLKEGKSQARAASVLGISRKVVVKYKRQFVKDGHHLPTVKAGRIPYHGHTPVDQVLLQTAISTASAIIGIDSRHVRSRLNTHKVARVRAYAALALRAVFDGDVDPHSIARAIGAEFPERYFSNIDTKINNDMLRWWDNDIFLKVYKATEGVLNDRKQRESNLNNNGNQKGPSTSDTEILCGIG